MRKDLGSRGIVLCSKNQGTDKLCSYCAADLHLSFLIEKSRFSHDMAHIADEEG